MNTLKYSLFSAELTVKLWLTFLLLFSATVTSFIMISSQSLSWGGGGTKEFHHCHIISKDIRLPGQWWTDRLMHHEQRDEEVEKVGWTEKDRQTDR